MRTQFIGVEIQDNIGMITLNNPQTLNAVNETMLSELASQITEFEQNNKVKVIILKGLEQSFAAGLDIKYLAANYSRTSSIMQNMQQQFDIIAHAKKPIISVVSGFALGIGCELVLISDIVLATENAQFSFPELSLGLLPCFGGCHLLASRIGVSKAMDVILSGRALNAEEAEKAGIVSRIVDASAIEEEYIKLARRLSALPQRAVLTAKQLILSATSSQNHLSETLLSLSRLESADFKNSLLKFVPKKA